MNYRRDGGEREAIKEYDPCWLRYERIEDEALAEQYRKWCRNLAVLGSSPILDSAKEELVAGISSMLGISPTLSREPRGFPSLVLAAPAEGEPGGRAVVG